MPLERLPMRDTPGKKIAVVGAGIAGLAAARTLSSRGHRVQLFDKGRAPGGRVATRRYDDQRGRFHFDHGAQYFTVRDATFKQALAPLLTAGTVKPWNARFGVWDGNIMAPEAAREERYVGVPGMSAMARSFAADLDVSQSQRVCRLIDRSQDGWSIGLESGAELHGFDELVLAIPDAQAHELLTASGYPELSQQLPTPLLAPCWAVLVAFDKTADTAFDAVFARQGPLSWAARDVSKPGREASADTWVLHLNPLVSAERIEVNAEEIQQDAIAAWCRMHQLKEPPQVVFVASHRWRYAAVGRQCDAVCVYSPQRHLGVCGDWLAGGRVEGAFLSGVELASRIIDSAGAD